MSSDVYTEAKKRIINSLKLHDRHYIAFSGGKDSGVMLHLVIEEAMRLKIKIGILIVDTEAQYTMTNDFLVKATNEYNNNIELFWVCLPLKLDNTISSFSDGWICWDKDKRNSWVREQNIKAITDYKYFDFYKYGMDFYSFVKKFGEWYSNGKKTACFVGLRAEESLNRLNIFKNKNEYIFNKTKNVNNIYPIYDWKFSDIWHYNYKFNKSYNEIYDLMNIAGVKYKLMRVGQLFGNEQQRSLHIIRILDHKIWVGMLYRVNGVDFTSRVTKDGFLRNLSKPKSKTWEQFSLFICDTLPKKNREKTKEKIYNIISIWKKRGYPKGIPDEAPLCLEREAKVPSWRRVCKSLLKNDFSLSGFGIKSKDPLLYKKHLEIQNKNILIGSLF